MVIDCCGNEKELVANMKDLVGLPENIEDWFRMATKNFIVSQILWEYSVYHSYVFIHTYESGYFRRLLCLWASHSYGVILCIFIDLERKKYHFEFT